MPRKCLNANPERRETRGVTRLIALVAAGFGTAAGCAHAKEQAEVVVSYTVAPERALPPGLEAVAVIDSGVRAGQAGGRPRERKWSSMAADMVEAMILAASDYSERTLNVADRRNMKLILDEQDLRVSGLVDTETAHRVGTLLEVQGLIVSRIVIDVDYQKSTKQTVDWGGLLGGMVRSFERREPPRDERHGERKARAKVHRDPRTGRVSRVKRVYRVPPSARRRPAGAPIEGVAPLFQTREVEEVSRHLTVQCSFRLIDAVTGEAVYNYSPPPYRKTDRKAPDFLFGGFVEQEELNPVDHFIGELVERAAREFVSMLVPVEVEYRYEVTARGKAGENGIQALRADEYETALARFEDALREHPDRHENLFALGVTSELLGRWEDALEYYRRATTADDVDEEEMASYMAAKRRLSQDIDRIIDPEPIGRTTQEDVPPTGSPEASDESPEPAASESS